MPHPRSEVFFFIPWPSLVWQAAPGPTATGVTKWRNFTWPDPAGSGDGWGDGAPVHEMWLCIAGQALPKRMVWGRRVQSKEPPVGSPLTSVHSGGTGKCIACERQHLAKWLLPKKESASPALGRVQSSGRTCKEAMRPVRGQAPRSCPKIGGWFPRSLWKQVFRNVTVVCSMLQLRFLHGLEWGQCAPVCFALLLHPWEQGLSLGVFRESRIQPQLETPAECTGCADATWPKGLTPAGAPFCKSPKVSNAPSSFLQWLPLL